MSLENLHKIGQLKPHPRDPDEIERLLSAAARGIADARSVAISAEHVTVIQALPLTLGIESARVVVLDTLRRKRNLADYTGDDIDHASVTACIDEASRLLQEARGKLTQTK